MFFVIQCEVEKQLNVKKDLQRLFFSGKQLESGYHLANYNIKFNDTILLMVKTLLNDVEDKENTKEEKVNEEKELEKEALEINSEKAESLYYKIGDAVDCMYDKTGAWYEAIIENIYKKEAQMFYKISWEFDNTLCPDDIPEIYIRPRAQRSILFDELSIGQKVMINYNLDNAEKIGLWYDFTITDIITKRKLRELFGQLYINRYVFVLLYQHIKQNNKI